MITVWAFVAAGIASWYAAPGYNSAAHTCAMYLAPKGTVVRIVNVENHRSSWCTVTDYGPDAERFPKRIIDVMPVVAKDLGFYPALGVARVRVYRRRRIRLSHNRRRTCGVLYFCPTPVGPCRLQTQGGLCP